MRSCLLLTLALSSLRLQEEVAVIPVHFVLRRLTRDVSLLIISTATGATYMPPSVPHRQKKGAKKKKRKSGLVASIRGTFFLSAFALFVISSGRLYFQPLHTISNDMKHHTMAKDKPSSRTHLDESLLPSSHCCCCQLLLPRSHNHRQMGVRVCDTCGSTE